MNAISEAIILVGGLGTRLYPLTKNLPKPMLPVNNRPFLEYILDYLQAYGINKVILCVGYKYQTIINHFGNQYKNIEIKYSIEDKVLGTGGAIKKALSLINNESAFVLNGDTYFDVDLFQLSRDFNNIKVFVALKRVAAGNRYGMIILNERGYIQQFIEKKSDTNESYINGGIYLVSKNLFDEYELDSFSFELFLQEYCRKYPCRGIKFCNSYFIDIGIHSDYEKAQIDFGELF